MQFYLCVLLYHLYTALLNNFQVIIVVDPATMLLLLSHSYKIKNSYFGVMSHGKHFAYIAQELGLNFSEDIIDIMLGLLESGVSPDNLLKILENIKTELKSMH